MRKVNLQRASSRSLLHKHPLSLSLSILIFFLFSVPVRSTYGTVLVAPDSHVSEAILKVEQSPGRADLPLEDQYCSSSRLVLGTSSLSPSTTMADGEFHAAAPGHGSAAPGDGVAQPGHKSPSLEHIVPLEQVESFMRSKANTPNPFSRQHTSLDLDDYFVSRPPLVAVVSDANFARSHPSPYGVARPNALAWPLPATDRPLVFIHLSLLQSIGRHSD